MRSGPRRESVAEPSGRASARTSHGDVARRRPQRVQRVARTARIVDSIRNTVVRASRRSPRRARRSRTPPAAATTLGAPMKRYHVTTFGCQMNEHDSERMKGMLESLGYAEAAEAERRRPHPLQHVLDPREGRRALHRAPRQGRRAQAARPRARRSASAAAGRSRSRSRSSGSSRSSTSRSGPGQVHKLAEFLTSDSITAQGFFEFEGFTGHLPMKRARDFQAWMQISVGCNCRCSYCIVPSTRGREVVAAVRRARRRGRAARRRGRPRGDAARPERQLLRARPAAGPALVRRAAARDRRDRHRARALHVAAPEGHARGRHPLPRRAARRCASTSTCRSSRARRRSSRRCAARTSRERYLDRVALIREHVPDVALTTDIIVGFPGETEEDFAQTLDVVEEVGYDGAFTFIYSPRRGTEAATIDRRLRPARGRGRADGAARRGRPAPRARARAAVRRAHDGGARRGHVAHRPDAAARPHAAQQGRELHRPRARPARSCRSRSRRRRRRRWPARSRCSPAPAPRA